MISPCVFKNGFYRTPTSSLAGLTQKLQIGKSTPFTSLLYTHRGFTFVPAKTMSLTDVLRKRYKQFQHYIDPQKQAFEASMAAEGTTKYLKLSYKIYRSLLSFKNSKDKMDLSMAVIGLVVDYNLDSTEFKDFFMSLIPGMEADFGDHLKNARTLFDLWTTFEESEFVVHTERLTLAILCAGFLNNFGINFTSAGYTEMEADKHRKKFDKKFSLYRNLGESLLYMTERGYQYYLTGDIKETIFHGTRVHAFFRAVDEFREMARCDPNDFETSQERIIIAGKVLIEQARSLKAGHAQYLVNRAISEIEKTVETFDAHFNVSATRKLPYSLLLFGPPGIAKSQVANDIFAMYHAFSTKHGFNQGMIWDRNSKYVRNFADEFWSAYIGQWAVMLDDIGYEHIKQLVSGQGRSLNELIQCCNEVGFSTNQAALEDKGKRPFRARCIVATSNKEHINAFHAVSTPEALQRRLFRKVEAVVKEQHRKPDSYQMAPTENPSTNAWDFYVQELHLNKHGKAVSVHIPGSVKRIHNVGGDFVEKQLMSGEEFAAYLEKSIVAHERHCAKMQEFANDFSGLCEHETFGRYCDKCVEAKEGLKAEAAGVIVEEAFYQSIPFASWFYRKKLQLKYYAMRFGLFATHWSSTDIRYMLEYYAEGAKDKWKKIIPAICVISFCGLMAFNVNRQKTEDGDTPVLYEDAACTSIEKENIWTNDAEDFTDVIGACRTVSGGDLVATIERTNLFELTISSSVKARKMNALGLYGHWFVTTAHGFQDGGTQFGISIKRGPQDVSLRDEQIYFVRNEDIIFNMEHDLAFFHIKAFRPVRDIRKFILPTKLSTPGYGTLVASSGVSRTQVTKRGIYYEGTFQGSPIRHEVEWSTPNTGVFGDCGSPIVFHHPQGNFIAGILSCASTEGGGFQYLTSDMIPDTKDISDAGLSYITNESDKIGELGPLHGKSIARHVSLKGRGIAYGSFPSLLSKPKMRTRPSKLADSFIQHFGGEIEHGTPVARGRMVDGEYKSPELRSLQKRSNPITKLDYKTYQNCANEYIKELINGFDMDQIYPVSQDIALNGIEGDPWVNKIDRSTSGGAWAPGPKRRQMELVDGKYVLNEFMQNKLDELLRIYKNWERAHVLFDAHQKDEALPWKKIDSIATRIFMGCSFEFTMCVRMATVMFSKQFMIHNEVSESFVGLNCYRDWGKFKNYLTKNGKITGDRFGDGDYSEYDTKMNSFEMMIAFDVVTKVCMASGNFDGWECIFAGIAVDCSFPNVRICAALVMFFGSNMSGHPLTVIINSIVNSIRMRYAYIMITKGSISNFRKEVSLATYGDDNSFGTLNRLFCHSNIQTVFANCGIKYTDAAKSDEVASFKKISEISFLKRTIVDSPQGVLCPIELKTIRKMITVITPSKTIGEDQQLAEILDAANREMALHGEEVYNEAHAKFILMVEEFPEIKQWLMPRFYEDWRTQLAICRGEWTAPKIKPVEGAEAGLELVIGVPIVLGLRFTEAYQQAKEEEFAKQYVGNGHYFSTIENFFYYLGNVTFVDRIMATIMHPIAYRVGPKMGTFIHALFNTIVYPIPSPMSPLYALSFFMQKETWKPKWYAGTLDEDDMKRLAPAAIYFFMSPLTSAMLYPDVWDYVLKTYFPDKRKKASQICLKAKIWLDTVVTPSFWDRTTQISEKRVSKITKPSSLTPIQESSQSEEQPTFEI